jgi:hypothetical protein
VRGGIGRHALCASALSYRLARMRGEPDNRAMDMPPPRLRSPDALATLIAVNVTPLAGILFLGWWPGAVLVSYFVDTFMGYGVVLLMVMVHVTGDGRRGPITGWTRWARALAGLAILGAIMAVPVAFPVWIVLADDSQARALLRDTTFLLALAVQVLMSTLAAVRLHRVLQATHDDERILAPRVLFLTARWAALFIAVMTGLAGLFGPRFGGFLLVAVYAGASVYYELFPERTLWLRGKGAKPIAFAGDLESRAAQRRRRPR